MKTLVQFFRESPPVDTTNPSFSTHLNYIKCVDKLFANNTLSVSRTATVAKQTEEINKFLKLHLLTLKSIEKDIELAREDSAFAIIAAPWFPVKCYYAIYYLESVLTHLVDGNSTGFSKGGHTGMRTRISTLVASGAIKFSSAELNRVYILREIDELPIMKSGQNVRSDYWQDIDCINSVVKKLMDYKLKDAKLGHKWNLRRKKDQQDRKKFIDTKLLMIPDFFYWYRIKANYRDLEYLDFENGITESAVLLYLETYNSVFENYRNQLMGPINSLL